ncbi:SCP2 sterol-binding domain-containing protein [Sciscionella marina]|uniref:SCP2 sterol-binding domain-containing protein n=1 Tax=Sciscionella marina TaxID=508770 RepID=UPI0003722C8C|nr:SCP2 sterol-binding domain-containing protein [Sciscionella marina]
MAIFQSADEMFGIVEPFLGKVTSDPELGPKFVKANTSFRVDYHDPSGTLVIDATGDPVRVLTGAEATAADTEVALSMSGDDGHKFWLGDLNLPISLAKRKVKTSGNLTKMLGLLPVLTPAYAQYKAYLKDIGRDDLL